MARRISIFPLLIIGVLLFFVYQAFTAEGTESIIGSQSVGDFSVGKTCDEATDSYTNGAIEGQCYVSNLNNVKSVRYILDVEEKSRSCGISPACPTGSEPICNIDTNQDWSKIFSCSVAYDVNGQTKEVCTSDSECTSGKCVNALCQDSLPNSCTGSATRCVSESSYNTCQSSGQWSGNLQCSSGTTCYVDSCKTPSQIQQAIIDGQNDVSDTEDNNWLTDPQNQPIIYGGLAVAGFALLNR